MNWGKSHCQWPDLEDLRRDFILTHVHIPLINGIWLALYSLQYKNIVIVPHHLKIYSVTICGNEDITASQFRSMVAMSIQLSALDHKVQCSNQWWWWLRFTPSSHLDLMPPAIGYNNLLSTSEDETSFNILVAIISDNPVGTIDQFPHSISPWSILHQDSKIHSKNGSECVSRFMASGKYYPTEFKKKCNRGSLIIVQCIYSPMKVAAIMSVSFWTS